MAKKKKRWSIVCSVEHASGWQLWEVEAKDAKEALELHKKGKSEFIEEEVEVQSLGEPEISEVIEE